LPIGLTSIILSTTYNKSKQQNLSQLLLCLQFVYKYHHLPRKKRRAIRDLVLSRALCALFLIGDFSKYGQISFLITV
ncbi:MAG: hypothetical protein IJW62_03005, partial [Clostridia bacterium]|nr:hypothetical protein [Clostridia bacterium]